MEEYKFYDGITNKIKLELTDDSLTMNNIAKKFKVDKELIHQINKYYGIRKNIPEIETSNKMPQMLRVLNKDMHLTKTEIRKIMCLNKQTLTKYLEAYDIPDINKYRKSLCIKLLQELVLSIKEISKIVHYHEQSVRDIQRTIKIPKVKDKYMHVRKVVINDSKKDDIELINKCRDMLKDRSISKKQIMESLNISKVELNKINNTYGIRKYNERPYVSKTTKKIKKLLLSRQHTIKEIAEMVDKPEIAVRNVMKCYKIEALRDYKRDKVINLLKTTDKSIPEIAAEVNYTEGTISRINNRYGIREPKNKKGGKEL